MAASSGEHSSRSGTRGGVKHHIPGPAGFKRWLGGIQNRCMVGSKCKYGHAFAVVELILNVQASSRSGDNVGARLLFCRHVKRQSESPRDDADKI